MNRIEKTKLIATLLPVCVAILACLVLFVPGFGESDEVPLSPEKISNEQKSPSDISVDAPVDDPSGLNAAQGALSSEVKPGLVPASAAVDKSYFDDTAFVGDSVSVMLAYYQASTQALGGAQFFAAGSLSAANALWDVSSRSVHPSYNGTKMLVEDCIMYSGAKKVYIMLGMNDIGIYSLDPSIEHYKELVARIKAKSPDVIIFIQSMTPMASTSTRADETLNNTKIREYNEKLRAMCEEMGWYYLDVASVMYDESGYLRQDYCSDATSMGMHFTNQGCEQWVQYLLTHTVKFN